MQSSTPTSDANCRCSSMLPQGGCESKCLTARRHRPWSRMQWTSLALGGVVWRALGKARGAGGRGLQIVEKAASRWGSHPTAGGKVVWFEMDQPGLRAAVDVHA